MKFPSQAAGYIARVSLDLHRADIMLLCDWLNYKPGLSPITHSPTLRVFPPRTISQRHYPC